MVTCTAATVTEGSIPTTDDGEKIIGHSEKHPIHVGTKVKSSPLAVMEPYGPSLRQVPAGPIRIQDMAGPDWYGYSKKMTSSGTGVFLPRPGAYGGGAVVFPCPPPWVLPSRKYKKKGGNKKNNEKKKEVRKQVVEVNLEDESEVVAKDKYLFLPEEWSYNLSM